MRKRQEFIFGIIWSLSTHQEPVPSWVGNEFLLTPPPREAGKHPRDPLFILWHKGSLWGLRFHCYTCFSCWPHFLHCGCNRTTSCWELSQYILHSPSPNLLLFGQTFLFCCFTEAVLYSCVWPTASHYQGLLQAVSPSQARSWHAVIMWNPGQILAGTHRPHDFSWYIKDIAAVPFWVRVHTAIQGEHPVYVSNLLKGNGSELCLASSLC